MPVSAIDAHPLRNQFIDMLMRGESCAKVGNLAGISPQAVSKYVAKYIRPAAKAAANLPNSKAKTSVIINSQQLSRSDLAVDISRDRWLERVRKHEPLMDEAIEKAAKDGNFSGMATVASTRLKGLELEAKATGILDERPVTHASFVMMQGEGPHQVIEAEYRYSSESDEDISTDTTD